MEEWKRSNINLNKEVEGEGDKGEEKENKIEEIEVKGNALRATIITPSFLGQFVFLTCLLIICISIILGQGGAIIVIFGKSKLLWNKIF